MGVEQSGRVTAGHIARFRTDRVLVDGGPDPYAAPRVLASLVDIDLNLPGDAALILPDRLLGFRLTGVLATNASMPIASTTADVFINPTKPEFLTKPTPLVLNNKLELIDFSLADYALSHILTRDNVPDWMLHFRLAGTVPGGLLSVYAIGIELQ